MTSDYDYYFIWIFSYLTHFFRALLLTPLCHSQRSCITIVNIFHELKTNKPSGVSVFTLYLHMWLLLLNKIFWVWVWVWIAWLPMHRPLIPPDTMLWTLKNERALVLHRHRLQLPAPSPCWEIIQNENIFFCVFRSKFRTARVTNWWVIKSVDVACAIHNSHMHYPPVSLNL